MKLPARLACALASLVSVATAAPPAIDVGSRLQLLVDDYLIEQTRGIELKLQEPRSEGTVFTFDRPWEGVTSGYVTLFRDGDRYRMYYRGASDAGYTIKATVGPDEHVVPPHALCTCYAESRDGIHWTRPALGLFPFGGSSANNIVWMGTGTPTFSPFLDGNPAAPAAERYKAVASSNGDGDRRKPVLLAFVSPDGLRWRELPEPIITDGAFDSLNVVFWDSAHSRYLAEYRAFDHGVRSLKCATSPDFLHWTPGEWAEFGDAPAVNLYTNAAQAYPRAPDLYLAFPRRFEPWKTYFAEMAATSPGVSDGIFMSSRDGVHWHRFEEAFIRPGRNERNWAHRANTPAHGLLATGPEEISLYVERNYTFPTNSLERMTLRPDGFVAAHAGAREGELTTRPLVFAGKALVLNYATAAAGSVRVELQDERGWPIPGFSLVDSPLIFGDRIDSPVEWVRAHGRTDASPLPLLAGKPVRLRFVLRDADLFSFRFE